MEKSKDIILVIGSTGAGKSAFINLFCLLNKFNDIGYNDERKIARTQNFELQDLRTILSLIDPPGLEDTRSIKGIDQDKKNLKLVKELGGYKKTTRNLKKGRKFISKYNIKY